MEAGCLVVWARREQGGDAALDATIFKLKIWARTSGYYQRIRLGVGKLP